MALPWIKVAVDVADHPKIGVLERELTLIDGLGLAVVIRLWCWAARFYPDGNIPVVAWSGMARNALRDVMRTDGDNNSDNWRMIEAREFVDALTVAGLVERLDGSCQLHDWEDFNSAHAKKAEQNRERQRRFRERHAGSSTVSQAAAPQVAGKRVTVTPVTLLEVDKIREEERSPLSPRNCPGGDSGIASDPESQNGEAPALNGNGAHGPELPNGNGALRLPRVEQPRLRKRKRPETLAQSTKYELEQQVDERSRALARALEHEPMTEAQALAYANTRWPTGPPNERVVALAFEAYAMRAGAAPGGAT